MIIKFDKEKHQYECDGEFASISVTQLLRKHGLAPDYGAIREDVLQRAAERGTDIHKDLELVITHKDYEPNTIEGGSFKEYMKEFIDCATAEQPLAIKWKGMWVAGTADVIGFMKKDNKAFIADHKTTSAINREYVSWQCSILDYMLRHLHEQINGKTINWKGADEMFCFHYAKDGELTVIKLKKIADEEIEKLLDAECFGDKYQRNELAIDDEITGNLGNIETSIKSLEARLSALKTQEQCYKDIILKKMEEQGIKSFECDAFKITYVYPKDSVKVDSTKLKKEYPEVYSKCTKNSHTNAYIQITLRDKEDE